MNFDLQWWLTVVVFPALGGFVWWNIRLQTGLSEYKLYVAEHYASNKALEDMEGRLTVHLQRIEGRLDGK